MSQETTLNEFEKKPLPSGLNVLTILSIIGCSIQLLFALYSFSTAKTAFEQKDKVMEQMSSPDMPSWAKAMIPDLAHFEETIIKSYENRVPIMIFALVAIFLCFYGVLQMRKLKKQGFLFYVIGELIPFVSLALFIGTFALTGFGFYVGIGISVLFILLYTAQRKHLVN